MALALKQSFNQLSVNNEKRALVEQNGVYYLVELYEQNPSAVKKIARELMMAMPSQEALNTLLTVWERVLPRGIFTDLTTLQSGGLFQESEIRDYMKCSCSNVKDLVQRLDKLIEVLTPKQKKKDTPSFFSKVTKEGLSGVVNGFSFYLSKKALAASVVQPITNFLYSNTVGTIEGLSDPSFFSSTVVWLFMMTTITGAMGIANVVSKAIKGSQKGKGYDKLDKNGRPMKRVKATPKQQKHFGKFVFRYI